MADLEAFKRTVETERNKKFDYFDDSGASKANAIAKKAKDLGIPFRQYVSYAIGEDFGEWVHSYIKVGNEKIDAAFDPELASKVSTGRLGHKIVWDESYAVGKSWRDKLTEIALDIKEHIPYSRIINLYMSDPKKIYVYTPGDEREIIKEVCKENGVRCNVKRKLNGISTVFIYP